MYTLPHKSGTCFKYTQGLIYLKDESVILAVSKIRKRSPMLVSLKKGVDCEVVYFNCIRDNVHPTVVHSALFGNEKMQKRKLKAEVDIYGPERH